MLNFEQIKEYFDSALKFNPKGMLTEYLQFELLDSFFKQPGSEKLSFIGGTAIRIIHDSERFSEDLDFDNFGLSYASFKNILSQALSEMKLKGFTIEPRIFKKDKTYHAYLKFPDLLFHLGLSGHKEEKIFLSLDAERKKKLFAPETKTLNKFGVYKILPVDPAPILLAQKLLAILHRRREKGRDFYDASFLGGKTKPDYGYIKKCAGLDKDQFAQKIEQKCSRLNFKALAKDVEPFLLRPEQADRVLHFMQNLRSLL